MRKDCLNTSSPPPGGGSSPSGGFVLVGGETYYRISAFDRMPPFMINLPSDTDLWMFVVSNGGLTAGRVDPDGSIFPYQTVDWLKRGHYHTGPITLIGLNEGSAGQALWEPFSFSNGNQYSVERNLYKNVTGNRLIFEEINRDLGLVFSYRWSGCDEFGHVRTAVLENHSGGEVSLSLLDGLRNVLPYGAPLALYQQSSSLVDAYKRTDLYPESGMAVFSLTSRIIDRAEAAEELRANAAWCRGLEEYSLHLSLDSVKSFREGGGLPEDETLTGRPGNFLVNSRLNLAKGERAVWHIAADSGRSHLELAELKDHLTRGLIQGGEIEGCLDKARDNLVRIVGSADGIQLTGHREASVHHFANVLFNNMRGGIFSFNYTILKDDFADFIQTRNRPAAERHSDFLDSLPESFTAGKLKEEAKKTGDADLIRLTYEYLPLYFGRRHGDPSRPWNLFSIRVKGADGEKALDYQGNWRDIFQNWEGLCLSFPGFIPNMIAKFVNASTIDGFNPYRITREGIDWEVSDPEDPWSYIGYWGDHQIIYLLKFLEALPRYYPGRLEDLFEEEIFSYTDVPYRIKPYRGILKDPRSTITFDTGLASRVADRARSMGSDGKLYHQEHGKVYHVNLLEKVLVPILAKLSNLVPGGGIWMNTQRPEWNDANNALAGNGISVVTLCYLRRHLRYLSGLLGDMADRKMPVSREVVEWFSAVRTVLEDTLPAVESGPRISGAQRKRIMDMLGGVFSEYRDKVYSSGFSGKRDLRVSGVVSFLAAALAHVDRSIQSNRREDGLYHSYNILKISKDGKEANIERLYQMLEGQVAVLSSGLVGPGEAADIMESLFRSPMYAEDRKSFLLYPEKDLPDFFEKNVIPEEEVEKIPLLAEILSNDDTSIVARDASGAIRFNSDFAGAGDLSSALDRLSKKEGWGEAVSRDRQKVLEVFEKVFRHGSFTGRSGTMYGYEGIGCIYWHMVSKLLLALQEIVLRTQREGEDEEASRALTGYYYRVRSGLGFEKSVSRYGAFPTDPYSHTPRHAGARQPGMTGQVKEEIITRLGELGVDVRKGEVSFDPVILSRKELLGDEGLFEYYGLSGSPSSIKLDGALLAFTFCQVPVVYHSADKEPWIRVTGPKGAGPKKAGNSLGARASEDLFDRNQNISRIDVGIPEEKLIDY